MTETTFKTILFLTPIVYWVAVFWYVFYQAGKGGGVGYFYFVDELKSESVKTNERTPRPAPPKPDYNPHK